MRVKKYEISEVNFASAGQDQTSDIMRGLAVWEIEMFGIEKVQQQSRSSIYTYVGRPDNNTGT